MAHVISRDMMQKIIAGNGKGEGAEIQDHAEEHRGEATVDTDGPSS